MFFTDIHEIKCQNLYHHLKILKYIFICWLLTTQLISQNTINVNYLARPPFTIKDTTSPTGIEIDIINEYLLWLKSVKKKDFDIKYSAFTDVELFKTATVKNAIGLGAFITTNDKYSEYDYSVPYMKNLSFCITNGNAPDIKNKNQTEVYRALASMQALTIDKTNLNNCVLDVKKTFLKDLKINYVNSQFEILNGIAKNVLVFGYVDAIEFWYFLKNNPNKFLKVQKSMEQAKENYSFIFPKGSEHKLLFNEFFLNFKNGLKYKSILEKYMGGFMGQNMAVK